MTSHTWAKDLGDFLDQRTDKQPNGCWLWTKRVDGDGYGRTVDKWYRIHGKSGAHQLSYIWHHGPIGHDKQVCHTCDNPTCINPAHLFLGSNQDNMTDKVIKGRQIVKLTETQVLEIRSRYATGSFTQAELAPDYDVSEEAIRCVVNRKSWRHI